MDELTQSQGIRPDPRTSEQKQQDYTHQDILAGAIPSWTEKPLVTLDIRQQSISSSCVAQSGAKALTSFMGQIMSALPPFYSRSNYPSYGMYLQELGDFLIHIGTDLESVFPSQNMTDEQLDTVRAVFKDCPFKISTYYFIPTKGDLNMDLLAQALDKGHALVIGVESNTQEWIDVPVFTNTSTTFSHATCCHSKNYLLYNGEKSIGIDDSCNLFSTINQDGQRILTESFLKSRCWGIMALIPVSTEHVIPRPHHTFNTDLSLGNRGEDVTALQDILKFETCMPAEIDSTGYFGPLTKNAVIKLQEKYASLILSPANITKGTGYVGSFTRSWLNENYK